MRRRQRLSSSCTEPAERSPTMSSRAISLRISTGKVIEAVVERSEAPNENGASPSGRPLRSWARTVPVSGLPASARSTFTVSAPAAFSAPASASAGGRPPSTTMILRSPISLPRSATKALPLPRSIPSESQTSSAFGVAWRKREIAGSASLRSIVCGFGLSCDSATRAAAAVCRDMSRVGSASGISATGRLSESARAEQIVGGAQPRIPACSRRPVVVDHQAPAAPSRSQWRAPDSTTGRRPR